MGNELITPDIKDKNGVDVLLGSKIVYFDLYECHSDAVDYFDVEPQNNFAVNEVFIQKKTGVVVFERCAFRVDGIVVSELGHYISDRIIDMNWRGDLGMELRAFILDAQNNFGKCISKQIKQIEVIKLDN